MNSCKDCLRWEGKGDQLRARCSLLMIQVGCFGSCEKFSLRPHEYSCLMKPQKKYRLRVFPYRSESVMDSIGARRSSSAWTRTGHSGYPVGLLMAGALWAARP